MSTDKIPPQNIGFAGMAYNEALRCWKNGEPMEAIIYLKRAVELEPNFIDGHYDLAVTYYQLGRMDEACMEYEIVLRLRPNDVDALNNLGTILAHGVKLEEAKALFDKALEIDPGFALTYRNLAAYYQATGDNIIAQQYARRAMAIDKEVFNREPGPPRIRPSQVFAVCFDLVEYFGQNKNK